MKTKHLRLYACFFLGLMAYELMFPMCAWALTGGPDQPEMHGFQSVGTSDMVDLFTGDFSYNVPLIDVGGYPLNIAYHSGVTMDEEASWVGLGWSLNPGVVNKEMRGIPDEFNGQDIVQKEYNIKDNWTVGLGGGVNCEIGGGPISIGARGGLFYNNYKGPGVEGGVTISANMGHETGGSLTAGLGFNSQSGADFDVSGGLHTNNTKQNSLGLNIGGGVSSRQGLKDLSFGASYTHKAPKLSLSSADVSGGFSFGYPTYMPSGDFQMNNESYSFHGTLGGEVIIVHPNFQGSGYFTRQYLVENQINQRAYGTLYAEGLNGDDQGIQDMNREKDIPLNKYVSSVAVPFGTYDIFSVQGQGISGQYKISRQGGRSGYPYKEDASFGAGLGVEIGGGELVHAGGDVHANWSKTTQQRIGGADFGYNWGLNESKLFSLESEMKPTLFDPVGREPRAQVMSYLTATEANQIGLDKTIKSYPANSVFYADCNTPPTGTPPIRQLSRLAKPKHHLSELTVTGTDGSRYVYGIPAYVNKHIEASFRVPQLSGNPFYTSYNASGAHADNSLGNNQGQDHFYEKTTTPCYAHSFLLTGVLSPDYVDLTNDGISDDDPGSAIKFTYTRADSQYRYRTPLGADSANYQEGLYASDHDQRANYVYGEKELWYVHSVESKTMVAFFFVSPRQDGKGALGENGGIDATKNQMRLDSIALYSKADLKANANAAVPIKTVHFKYEYSLCPGIRNTTGTGLGNTGKLTLKEIFFTYGRNTRGKLNGYKFAYKDSYQYSGSSHPFGYDQRYFDKWGNYQNTSYQPAGYPSSVLFPYTLQDSAWQNRFCAAWSLDQITLPSGGKINVSYEPDDYAYVENHQAGQMFFVAGFGSMPTAFGDSLYGGISTQHDCVFFELTHPVANADELYDRYLSDLNHTLYYTCKVNLRDNKYEWIKGYATFGNDYGVTTIAGHHYGYIKMDEVSNDGVSVQPVALAALQKMRLELPEIAYDVIQSDPNDAISILTSFVNALGTIRELFSDYNKRAINHSRCKAVDCAMGSWIRLGQPDFKKYGGGSRVKRVTVNDNWGSTGYGSDFTYGTEYGYTMQDSAHGIISSGVASWEPSTGNDELLRRQPVMYSDKIAGAPDNFYYVEEPMGESLFPSPVVGYSRVTVKNISRDHVVRTATGYQVHEFYTAKEFPTVANHSALNKQVMDHNANKIFQFLKLHTKYELNASEDFNVTTNDMHGKPKKESVYNENGELISSTFYHYKTRYGNAPVNELDNGANLVKANGEIASGVLGISDDQWTDSRMQETISHAVGVSVNVESFFIIVGIVIPLPWPSYNKDEKRCRITATTHLERRNGILDYTEKFENGSTVRAENLLYDAETGQPVLTRTTNEFDDPLYTLTYPAHWAYEGMGEAYKNIGGLFFTAFHNGLMDVVHPETYFVPGDELFVEEAGITGTVIQSNDTLRVVDDRGKALDIAIPQTIKVVRSGRRNLAAAPIGTVQSRYPAHVNNDYGLVSSNLADILSDEIINASASTYSDKWQTNCTNVPSTCSRTLTLKPECKTEILAALIGSGAVWDLQAGAIPLRDMYRHAHLRSPMGGHTCYLGAADSSAYYYATTTPSQFNSTHVFHANFGGCPLTVEYLYGPGGASYWFDSARFNSTVVPLAYNASSGCSNCWRYQSTSDPNTALFNWRYTHGSILDSVGYRVTLVCPDPCTRCVSSIIDSVVNPYRLGIKGVWRPERSYVYYSDRTPRGGIEAVSNLRRDGMISSFKSFWKYNDTLQTFAPDTVNKRWAWNARITAYDQKGNEVENKDPLNRYSAALYGYNKSLATATASNAKVKQVGVDNFEDYDFTLVCNPLCNISQHWGFKDGLPSSSYSVSTDFAHTGLRSLKVNAGGSAVVQRAIEYPSGNPLHYDENGQYVADRPACLDLFSPDSGQYLLSAWVKEDTACNCPKYEENSIQVYFTGSTASYTFKPAGPVIEGWQRYEAKFAVPHDATAIFVKLLAAGRAAYFDDVRVHPWYGNMKSYVYNPHNLRLMATLDENNYATFYEYDDEGNLVRVKKETERGVQTIKESRNVLAHP